MASKSSLLKVADIIFKKYGVATMFDNSVEKDNGWVLDKEIHMSNSYSNASVMVAVWCHEFGHYLINTHFSRHYDVKNVFQCEFKAWDLAQRIHFEYFGKPFNKTQGSFCLNCLSTYSQSHYDFKHTQEVYGKTTNSKKLSK